MNHTFRNFHDAEDGKHMTDLAIRERKDTLHVMDLPYRLSSWALDDPANIGLWFDPDGNLLAWAVMQLPFWTVDMVMTAEADAALRRSILAWIDRRALALIAQGKGIPCWYIMAFARQTDRISLLEAHDFACQADVGEDSWSKVWMRRTAAQDQPHYPAPAGFQVRSLAGEADVPAYVDLHRAVFESRNMTEAWRRRTLTQEAYRAGFDVLVTAPDGRPGAFCIGWMQQGQDGILRGQIEPLGCHADFRRYALGRVALAAVIARLHAAGAQEIWVETDNYRDTAFRLYRQQGFEVVEDVLVFRKEYQV